ncbi:MAG: hypothetical protein ACE5PV_20880 [Candidatus Poribacteria bacterium]
MERNEFIQLLRELLLTHSPSGDEGEMETLVKDKLESYCDKVWMDDGDN